MSEELIHQPTGLDNINSQAQKVHQVLQQAAEQIGVPINTVLLNNNNVLYQAENNQNFSVTGPGMHYQQQNGLVQVVMAQPGLPINQQTSELQVQTQLNQTERAFFNSESQGNTSKRERDLRLSQDNDAK